MNEEPASYRSGSAAFELHFGSALKAILPGAFQGAVIGSLIVAVYSIFASLTGGMDFGGSGLVGAIMMFCFIMMIGTMGGMIVCAIYIGVVGLPIALVMRRRIATPSMLVITLIVSTLAGLAAGWALITPIWGVEEDRWMMIAMALCYAVPAGVAYRRAIITERMLSFWSSKTE
ncbi:MAG: hypothetical protein AAF251_14935 [Pseudomonadota bacterium]